MKFKLITDHPVALDSPDHIQPHGTKRDNTIKPRFNECLIDCFEGKKPSVLDFGCAGGGMVRSLIDDGCIAVGLEGSDYNLVRNRKEWRVIPDNLFTCDLGYPFTLTNGSKEPYQFDVITAWEFLEHMPEERLPVMIENMRRHLKPKGLLIGSTNPSSTFEYAHAPGDMEHHLTQKSMVWWSDLFWDHGFKSDRDIEQHFNGKSAWLRFIQFAFVYRKR